MIKPMKGCGTDGEELIGANNVNILGEDRHPVDPCCDRLAGECPSVRNLYSCCVGSVRNSLTLLAA